MKRADKMPIRSLVGKSSGNGNYKVSIMDLVAKDHEKIPELLCDNPKCRIPITGEKLAYSSKYREIYHNEDCANTAFAYKSIDALRSMETSMICWDVINITREEALRIKSGLEKKTK